MLFLPTGVPDYLASPNRPPSPPKSSPDKLFSSHAMAHNWILDQNEQLRFVWFMDNDSRLDRPRPPGRNGKCIRKSSAGHAVCFREDPPTPASSAAETAVSCTTFNILAPIYKRIGSEGCRESQFRESWLSRNQGILDMLLFSGSSIVCLQEFWLGNEELVRLYEGNLSHAGYQTFKLARTNNRGDGLLTAIKSERLRVLNYKELFFNDCGDRVAQFFHLRCKIPYYKRGQSSEQELLLVNTHLLFPHDSSFCLIRLRQVCKIIEFLEHFKMEHSLASIPVILCGDWNGSKRGHVYKFLRSQGFVSAYDTAHSYTDSDAHRWVSHRNHRGNICGVDFIWLLNPSKDRKPLSGSWKEAVLGIIKAKLCEAGLKGKEAYCFFQSKENGDLVTFHEFQRALRQLGLTENGSEGLSRGEIEDLMQTVDVDGNGLIDYTEFEASVFEDRFLTTVLNPKEHMRLTGQLWGASNVLSANVINDFSHGQGDLEFWESKGTSHAQLNNCTLDSNAGFAIQDAFLFPPEVEKGFWPEDYFLSDHAPLTAVFIPLKECDG